MKTVHNVLGILSKTILKFRNKRFYKNFYSENCRILNIFDTLFGYFWREINIEIKSKNINCGHS